MGKILYFCNVFIMFDSNKMNLMYEMDVFGNYIVLSSFIKT